MSTPAEVFASITSPPAPTSTDAMVAGLTAKVNLASSVVHAAESGISMQNPRIRSMGYIRACHDDMTKVQIAIDFLTTYRTLRGLEGAI